MSNFVKRNSDDWDEQTKIHAVQTYIKLGNSFYLTAKTLDIPRSTLLFWGKQDWWAALYDEFKQEEDIEISSKLRKIIGKSLAIVEDCLENGDPYYDPRTGEIKRKPVNIRDAHMIFKDNLYAKADIENKGTRQVETATVMDKLSQLAKQFEDIANKKQAINVTDVVYVEEKQNALDDQREA